MREQNFNKKEHFFGKYDNLKRFISYFYQIKLAKKLKSQRVLEIGVGNKTVSNYLKHHGLKLDTCDSVPELRPDYVADIRSLPFESSSYDLVMACEVLEHLPWCDIELALKEIFRVTQRYVIISIPYSSFYFEFILDTPSIKRINLLLRMPRFYKKAEFDGEHYWEMGKKGFSKRKIRKELKKNFKIKEEVRPIMSSHRYFFVLEKI